MYSIHELVENLTVLLASRYTRAEVAPGHALSHHAAAPLRIKALWPLDYSDGMAVISCVRKLVVNGIVFSMPVLVMAGA